MAQTQQLPMTDNREPAEEPLLETSQKTYNPALEEYKLAVQIQQGYHDVFYKSLTIFIAITAISMGFIFRESINVRLKVIFCLFNLIFSSFLVVALTGFLKLAKRIARRMDVLALELGFALRNHNALSYGLLLTLISAICVFGFWATALFLRFWNLGVSPGTPTSNTLF